MAETIVGSVEKIVSVALKIKEAVDTVRRNEEECRAIAKCVARNSALLEQLQEGTEITTDTVMRDALENVAESFKEALVLVTACQQRHIIRRFLGVGDMAKKLRQVQEDIVRKIMRASAAIIHATIIVTADVKHAGAPPRPMMMKPSPPPPSPPQPPPSPPPMMSSPPTWQSSPRRYTWPMPSSSMLPPPTWQYMMMPSPCMMMPSPLPPAEQVVIDEGFRQFSLSELKAATNDFSNENIIGQGGYAIVYKGVLHDGLVVAVKKITDRIPNFDAQPMFRNEFGIGVKLQHKNIVKLLGYCIKVKLSMMQYQDKYVEAEERQRFLVLGYVPNGSLHNITKGRERIDWSSCFRMIEEIAKCVCYLHEHCVVHLDLKPKNILLDLGMNPVIIDFGISKVLDHGYDDEILVEGHVGTMGYMAPEYIDKGMVSTKFDVFAFGIILSQIISTVCNTSKTINVWEQEEWDRTVQEAGGVKGLLDPTLQVDESQVMEIERCIEVALLCTRRYPEHRPTMADVVQMLNMS